MHRHRIDTSKYSKKYLKRMIKHYENLKKSIIEMNDPNNRLLRHNIDVCNDMIQFYKWN